MSRQEIDGKDQEEQELRSIFSLASPRKMPPEALTDAVREAVRHEWQQATRPAWLRNRPLYLAAAAALLAAVMAMWSVLGPGSVTVAYPDANVLRVEGEVWLRHGADRQRLRSVMTARLAVGDALETGASGGVTLTLGAGRELRLGASSQVIFRPENRIDFARGRIFVNTQAPSGSAAKLEFHTAFGNVIHVGTRYQLVIEGDAMRIAVREGAVEVRGADAAPRRVQAGRWLRMTAEGEVGDGQDASDGEQWRWADALVVPLEIEGRSLMEVIQWAARESGKEIRFASADLGGLARTTTLHGGLRLDEPLRGLGMVIQTTSMDFRIEGKEVLIIERR